MWSHFYDDHQVEFLYFQFMSLSLILYQFAISFFLVDNIHKKTC